MTRLTPPPDAWIEYVPEPYDTEPEEKPTHGFCYFCFRPEMELASTDLFGKYMCVECEAESKE